jgi:hypothetical protein
LRSVGAKRRRGIEKAFDAAVFRLRQRMLPSLGARERLHGSGVHVVGYEVRSGSSTAALKR